MGGLMVNVGRLMGGQNSKKFNPYDIDALVVDTDFNRADLITLSGSLIESIADATGNGNTAVKITDAERPSLVERNGKNVGYWDATVRGLSYQGAVRSYDNSGGFSIFMIAEFEADSVQTTLIDRIGASGSREFRITRGADNVLFGTYTLDGAANLTMGNGAKTLVSGAVHAVYMNNALSEKVEIGIDAFDPVERDLIASPIFSRSTKMNTTIGRAFTSSANGHRGWIYRILIFNRGLTDAEKDKLLAWAKREYGVDAALKSECLTCSSIAAQSNMAYWDRTTGGYNAEGSAAFMDVSGDYFKSAFFYNGDGAVNSSAVHKDAATVTDAYWWDTDNNAPGPLYVEWRDQGGPALDNGSGARHDIKRYTDLISMIGETDSLALQAGTITKAQFKAAFSSLLNEAYSDTGANIYLSLLGARGATSPSDYRSVNEVMLELIDELPFVHFGMERRDIPRAAGDDTHHSAEGMGIAGARYAERVAAVRGRRPVRGTLGPIITGGTWNGATVSAIIQHDGGSSLSGSETNDFEILVNGAAATISSMTVNASSLVFTLASAIAGGASVSIRTSPRQGSNITPANVIKDDLGLPLRTTKAVLLSEI